MQLLHRETGARSPCFSMHASTATFGGDVEGLSAIPGGRPGLRAPAACQMVRNSNVTPRGGGVEGLAAVVRGGRAYLRPSAPQVLRNSDLALLGGVVLRGARVVGLGVHRREVLPGQDRQADLREALQRGDVQRGALVVSRAHPHRLAQRAHDLRVVHDLNRRAGVTKTSLNTLKSIENAPNYT